jgi:hypothetical protein
MPALVASRCDPHAKAFFDSLLARKKARLQALIAVSADHIVLTRSPSEVSFGRAESSSDKSTPSIA